MLQNPTAQVLQQLARRSATVKEVAEHLCAESGKVCEEVFLEHVERIFLQLQDAGLIEKNAT